jgi:glyoxylase-like metal-dependent hydrolase (beta-lactamase superfamily II)
MSHRISALLIIVPLAAVVLAATIRHDIVKGESRTGRTYSRPQLEYLKAVNRTMPPRDPQLLFLLMAEFSSANQQEQGIAFLTERLREFEPRLNDTQKALYLSAISVLRAQHANDVSLLHRIAYVRDTIGILDRTQQLSGGEVFIMNYLAGNIRAQLPARFNQQQKAREELAWCVANAEKAPNPGFLREVYYQQAKLAQAANDPVKAQEYLGLSGYRDLNRPIAFNTAFSEDNATGHTFVPPRISEPVPGRVYALSGFEFTEYYFVVSEDGRELIGIDAGTRPDAAKAAYEALRVYAPGLPALTTIFITHAHWDHVGGYSFFTYFNPRPRSYARSNYEEELTRAVNAPLTFEKNFFGQRFDMADVRRFKPDVTVDRATELRIGGTRVSLIPIQGGETSDGLLIHLPDAGVLFAGDFIMPYLGAPFLEEGNFQGLLDTIDIVTRLNPHLLLHGHEALTRVFASPAMLAQLKTDLAWLRDQVQTAIHRGDERARIHQANLISPELLASHPDAQFGYLLMREHVIDRLYDQSVGYWQADLQGVEHLSRADHAEALVDYLGISEVQLTKAVKGMTNAGKYELAADLLESVGERFAGNEPIQKLKHEVYLKLMERNQNFDPFKFIIYSAKASEQVSSPNQR